MNFETAGGVFRPRFGTEAIGAEGDLMAGFALAGGGRKSQPAVIAYFERGKDIQKRGQYDGEQLLRSSLLVEPSLHFRYDWGRSPLANVKVIENKDLPLVSQRSDDWGMAEALERITHEESARSVSREDSALL